MVHHPLGSVRFTDNITYQPQAGRDLDKWGKGDAFIYRPKLFWSSYINLKNLVKLRFLSVFHNLSHTRSVPSPSGRGLG